MSYVPNLLSWPGALLAAGLTLPILILLYFLKLRRKDHDVACTLLWKKAVQDLQVNAPFQRLRLNLLLLLQLLILLFLLFAFADPVLNYEPGPTKKTVILIDRSASMNTLDPSAGGKTRLEVAKEEARRLVDAMSETAEATVIAFDDAAQTMQPFTRDRRQLKLAIDGIKATHHYTNMKLAASLVAAQTHYNEASETQEVADIYLYSDGRIEVEPDTALQGNLNFVRIGEEKTSNLAITALSAKRNYDRPNEVQVFASLSNYGPEPIVSKMDVRIDGTLLQVFDVTVLPDRWDEARRKQAMDEGWAARDRLDFTADLTSSAIITLKHAYADGDALPADNEAWIVVPPPKQLSVLLVTDGNYFLEKALATLNLQQPKTITGKQYEDRPEGIEKFQVIMFDRHRPSYLPEAGSFIYFGTPPPDGVKVKGKRNELGWMLANKNGTLDWDRDHPMLRHMNFGRLYAETSILLDLPLEAETLIDGTAGPLMVLYRQGRQTHLIVTFDLLDSNWPLQKTFPATLSQAMRFLAVGSVRESHRPGAAVRVPRTAVQQVSPDLESVTLIMPDGSRRRAPIPPEGEFVLPRLDQVGLWKTDPPLPGYENIAVNMLNPLESNVLPDDQPLGAVGKTVVAAQGAKPTANLDLWWYLVAFAALPIAMIEWLIYTRRMHL